MTPRKQDIGIKVKKAMHPLNTRPLVSTQQQIHLYHKAAANLDIEFSFDKNIVLKKRPLINLYRL